MRKSKIKQITLAVCLALMPISIYAAGLGKLNVTSGLGEPLKAEIELLSMSPEELSSLVAAVASEEAYTAQGIARSSIHNNIKVDLAKSFSGAPILRLRSSLPVVDPYLDMLIQVDWASGRLQREYTVLLDPPGYQANSGQAAPAAISAPTVYAKPAEKPSAVVDAMPSNQVTDNQSVSPSKSVAKPAVNKVQKKEVKVTAVEQDNTANMDAITTERGDTLSDIAKEMQVDGVSLDQMLVALYENNKAAFSGSNMNRLKVGQIIKPPSAEQLSNLSAKQANSKVRIHAANWNEYRNTLAGVIANAPVSDDVEEKKQATSGKIATAEDKAAPVKSAPKDVVKLSAGEKAKAGADKDKNKEFEEKIAALQEETTAREKALTEAQDRTSALEKQIQDMQKLLALKSQTMATVQDNASTALKPAEVTPNAAAPVTTPTNPNEPNATPTDSTPPAEVNAAGNNTVAPAAELPKPAPVVKTPIVIPPPVIEEEPSFIESILGSLNLLVVGGAVALALLGAAWFFFRNKRRKNLDSFERGILTSGGLRANTVFGNTTGATGNSDTSFLTDFAQSADGSMIDTNDVDPIAEAEVYMAYGRDAQAEEILKDAITKEPKRYELHLKLLEMYAARQDTSAFEAIAGELYTTLGVDDPTWIKVAAIGAVMEPGNPLYDASKLDANLAPNDLATQKLDAADFANVAVSDDLDLDFSDISPEQSANDAVNNSFAGASATGQTAAFNLDDDSQAFLSSQNTNSAAGNEIDFAEFNIGADAVEEGSLDSTFDNLPVFETSSETSESKAPEKQESNSMDFDLGDFNFGDDTKAAEEEKKTDRLLESDAIAEFSTQNSAPDLNMTFVNDQTDNQTMESFPAFDMDIKSEGSESIEPTDSTNAGFDLPAFNMPEINEVSAESSIVTAGVLESEAANQFDVNFDLPTEVEVVDFSSQTAATEDISFDLDLPTITDSPASSTDAAELNALNLEDFIIDNGTAKADLTESEMPVVEANAFDLSGISLNLDDSLVPDVKTDETIGAQISNVAMASTPAGLIAQFKTMPRIDESEDVNIKLDLVAAYIDMEDTEGAHELLEEVLNEGGQQQKLRAQQLLDSIK